MEWRPRESNSSADIYATGQWIINLRLDTFCLMRSCPAFRPGIPDRRSVYVVIANCLSILVLRCMEEGRGSRDERAKNITQISQDEIARIPKEPK